MKSGRSRSPRAGWSARGVAWAVLCVACSAVPEPPPPDVSGPWLLGMTPSGNAVPVTSTLELRFSEPVKRDGVFVRVKGVDRPDGVALALDSREGTLLEALDAPPLRDDVVSLLVTCEVSMSADRRSVLLKPLRALAPETAYVVVVSRLVSDDLGQKLAIGPDDPANASVSVRFFTGRANDGVGPVATLKSPAPAATRVDPSVSTVVVSFDEAVDRGSVTPQTVGLVDVASGASFTPARVTWSEGGDAKLGFDAGEGSCAPLCTSRKYALHVAPTVSDLSGNPAPAVDATRQWFETARCFDRAPPKVAGDRVVVNASDVIATLTVRTDEPGPSRVDFVAGDAALLDAACRTAGDERCRRVEFDPGCAVSFDPCGPPPPESSYACDRRLLLDGLEPETSYAARVVVRDALGQGYTMRVVLFTTGEPVARPVLSEVFVAPASPLTSDAEFIELFNAGSGGVDLTGYRLARCPANPCTTALDLEWTLAGPDGEAWLEPGAFAVAAGARFTQVVSGLPDGTLLLSGPTATLLSRGLRDAEADGYALLDPAGRLVSTYAAQLGPATNLRGRSFERVSSTAEGALAFAPCDTPLPGAEPNLATPGAPRGGP